MKDIEKFFLDINFLSKFINNYKIRPSQIELAKFYNDAIEFNHSIICEAGTGSGKTLAYLIPVIKSKKKAIISTGTKNLQDQIFWYKASAHNDFKLGSKEFWELSKDLGSDDEDEQYDPNAFNSKRGPRINVKKNSGW